MTTILKYLLGILAVGVFLLPMIQPLKDDGKYGFKSLTGWGWTHIALVAASALITVWLNWHASLQNQRSEAENQKLRENIEIMRAQTERAEQRVGAILRTLSKTTLPADNGKAHYVATVEPDKDVLIRFHDTSTLLYATIEDPTRNFKLTWVIYSPRQQSIRLTFDDLVMWEVAALGRWYSESTLGDYVHEIPITFTSSYPEATQEFCISTEIVPSDSAATDTQCEPVELKVRKSLLDYVTEKCAERDVPTSEGMPYLIYRYDELQQYIDATKIPGGVSVGRLETESGKDVLLSIDMNCQVWYSSKNPL